jgi:quercetin dioxygenase-like cupin family protein
VIGEMGLMRDKPGFEVDFITRASTTGKKHSHNRPSVLMPVKGHWQVNWDGGSATLAPGDTMSVPENLAHSAVPSMTGEAALYHITATDDPAGLSWRG